MAQSGQAPGGGEPGGADVKVDVRREPGSRAVLEVEIPAAAVSAGVDRALRKINNRVVVPGFRRGKAPRMLLERHVGRDAVVEEAVNLLVPEAYSRALDQTGVQPIARPEIHVHDLEEGKPLRFTATVDLVPDVRLGDYRAIRIPYAAPAVSDAEALTRARVVVDSQKAIGEGGDVAIAIAEGTPPSRICGAGTARSSRPTAPRSRGISSSSGWPSSAGPRIGSCRARST